MFDFIIYYSNTVCDGFVPPPITEREAKILRGGHKSVTYVINEKN